MAGACALSYPPHPEVMVCWSGGCDSTLLLHHAARIYGTPSAPVRALSINSDQVTGAVKESQVRKRLMRKFKKMGLHIKQVELSITADKGIGMLNYGLSQAVMWLMGTQALEEKESLALGYIKGDDWPQHIEAFQSVFDTLQRVNSRTGNLWLPLIHTEKRGVLHQLRELELLDLTWWCGVPKRKRRKEPCGECKSCMTHETALWKLDTYGPPKHYWHGNLDGS